MRVLILAAGYGTRLYPLTLHTPKALLCIKGKPLLDFIMDNIFALEEKIKIDSKVLVCNDKFYNKFLVWQKERRLNLKIINDGSRSARTRLGAIKDIWFSIRRYPKGDWLIIGADNFFKASLDEFVKFALKKRPYPVVGLYYLKEKAQASKFGVVSQDKRGRIIEFVEKPAVPKSNLIATCIYFFPLESLNYLKLFLKEAQSADMAGKYLEWLITKTKVYGFPLKGDWLDIGTRESLEELKRLLFRNY